ncbi:MAG: hypothetical protein GY716_14200, partial [bacterium]|nr:hypothetical protein [bacterium]
MRRWAWLATLAVAVAGSATAQPIGIDIETEWIPASDAVHAGTTAHVGLRVAVPGKFHVNSHEPLDEFMIPTQLAVQAPRGFTVRQVVYPEAVLIDVQFADEQVSVFEQEFVIGVALDVADDVAPGTYTLRGALTYQACDDVVCLAPETREVSQPLRVVDASTTPDHTARLGDIDFDDAAATEPTTPPPPNPTPRASATPPAAEDCDVMAELSDFTVIGTAGGYLDAEDFVAFIDRAETG